MSTPIRPLERADAHPIADLIAPATAEVCRVLRAGLDRDWDARAGDLDWSCSRTAVHVADVLFSYAVQVVAQPVDSYLPMEVTVEPSATPDALVRSMVTCGELLRLAARSAPAGLRAWHPAGMADAEGFAAMGVVEALVHTHDITTGLGLEWAPPPGLSAPVLTRLFPDAPEGGPTEVLLWCCGRAGLGNRPRREEWRWDPTVRE